MGYPDTDMSVHDQIPDLIKNTEGWTQPDKLKAIVDVILSTQPNVCVEIGTFGGRSLIAQALALKQNGKGKVYGIDPWRIQDALEGETDSEAIKWWGKIDMEKILQGATDKVYQYGVEHYATLIRAPSQNVPILFPEIDVLVIDGCHSEVASCRDVEMYVPRVNANGWIFFDDSNWPSTQKAQRLLETMAESHSIVGDPNISTMRVFYKRNK